jgi:Flp pilus assembly secretin CpaC/tetratricopeptide (TPR) repeat protein
VRLTTYMDRHVYRPLLAVLLSWLLACPNLPAQSAQQASTSEDPHAMVKPDPKRAKRLVELGTKEEATGAYEAALAAYDEAVRYSPFDVTILGKAAALRSKLVQGYSEGAERLAIEGNLQGATQQLAAALHIDPTNDILQERLKQMQSMRRETKDISPEEPPEGVPQLEPSKGKKSFHFQMDSKGAFEQVAAAYGLKVSFDPDLPARNVKLRLDDVDFNTAMMILTLETGTFWKPLYPKAIFVAADTAEKRKAFDTVIEQTFVLPDSVSTAEMADIVKAVRDLTGSQRVLQSANAHSLSIRDTIPRVHLAAAIVRDLERSHGEVLLEFQFLEVDRDKARQLGITPPASLTVYEVPPNLVSALKTAPSYTALLTLLASVFGTAATGGISSLASAIPPIAAFGGGKSTFLLTLPSLSAQFSETLSLVQSGRQVLLRGEDGKAATFFAGERYPITLSLLSNSLGTSALTPAVGGVSTTTIGTQQFTVGKGPVAVASADLRSSGNQDLAVVNQDDNSVTILLNQGQGAVTQFAQAPGSPIVLGPAASSSTTTGIVSPSVPLTVTSATLKSIAVTPGTASIAPGGTQQFTAIGTFSDGTTQDITSTVDWTSSNTGVATIGALNGLGIGQATGTTAITATFGSLTSSAVTLNVTNATLRSIAVTPLTGSVARNGTVQLIATGTFSDGTTQNITSSASWTSSNTGIAAVGAGLVRGVAAGSAQITAAIGGITSPAAALTVTSATLKSIAVTPSSRAIAVGTSLQFTAVGTFSDGSTQNVTSAVAWASSETSVATINPSSGLATAVAAGSTSITATQGAAGSPVAIAIGTVDSLNNSNPDLVVVSQINNSVIILLGNGDGTFSSPAQAVSYVVGNQPSSIVLGTFNTNTDSNLDFVVTNFADNTYSVFTGNGNGTFTQVKGSPFHLPTGQTGPISVTSADFNQDGKPDLAIVNQTTNNVTVLEGNGDGTFTPFPGSPLPVGRFPVAIASGSLAGGTGPSLAVANQKDSDITVYLGNGNGTFVVSSQSPLSTTSAPADVTIADFAGTSTGGIAATEPASGTVIVYVDLGSGLFTEALEPAAGTNPGAILSGTFTGNALPDIVVTNNIGDTDGDVTLLVSPTSAISSGLVGQTPYPGSEYEDIGLKIKATPYVHPDHEVTLQLEYELKALSGSNNNGIPIISNEQMSQTIRLKEGETSIVSGLMDNERTRSISGLPGLAKIPYLGYLFGTTNDSFTNNELLILITPRALRVPERDTRIIYAGRGDPSGRGSAGGGAPPPIVPPPTGAPPEEPPAGAPAQPVPQPPGQAQPGPPPENPPPNTPAPAPPQQ